MPPKKKIKLADENIYDDDLNYHMYESAVLTENRISMIKLANYLWKVNYKVVRDNTNIKVEIFVDFASRYSFEDKVSMEVTVEAAGEKFEDVFDLAKERGQKFEVVFTKEEDTKIEDKDIKVTCKISVKKSEYNAKDVGTHADFTEPSYPHDVVLLLGETKFYVHKTGDKTVESVYEYGPDYHLFDTVDLTESVDKLVINVNYKWNIRYNVIREDGSIIVKVTANPEHRYSFDDTVELEVTVKAADKTITKTFELEKMVKSQNFSINLTENGVQEAKNEDIVVKCKVSTANIKYTAELVGTVAVFTDKSRPHDVVLVIGEKKLYVHKVYLATWSKCFNTLFYGQLGEKGMKEVKLEGVDIEEFEILMYIIHPDMIETVKDANVLYLLKLAHRFGMPTVMAMCGNHLMNFANNPSLTLMERLVLSDKHALSQLQVACLNKIHEKSPADFKAFLDENREQIKSLSYNTLKNLI